MTAPPIAEALDRANVALRRSPSLEHVAEALAFALSARAVLPKDEYEPSIEQAVRHARRALLATAPPSTEEDAVLVPLVRAAYDALVRGVAPRDALSHPSPRALVLFGKARLDAIETLEIGMHLTGCLSCLASLDLAGIRVRAEEPRLRVAAKSDAKLRAPADGVRLWAGHGAELIRFDDEGGVRIALYAETDAVELDSDAVVLEDRAPGYWIGVLAHGVERFEAAVHLGEDVHAVVIDVPHVD